MKLKKIYQTNQEKLLTIHLNLEIEIKVINAHEIQPSKRNKNFFFHKKNFF